MWIFFILFIILWILVTLFLPAKDMIEAKLLKTTTAPLEVDVNSQLEENLDKGTGEQDRTTVFDTYPKSGYCDVCSKTVKPHEGYLVPVDTFYNSEEYRNYLKKHPKAKAVIESKGIDTYIEEMRAQDKTDFSTICPDCIYLFD